MGVFLFFRVEIGKTFVSHLSLSLKKKDITAFTAPEPSRFDLQAIEKSEVAITVISKNYESLDWWINEVAKIIECENNGTLKTVPVFFQVDPSDVLRWLGHIEKYTRIDGTQAEKLKMVKKWLAELTKRSCFISRYWMDDSALVDRITRSVSDIMISSTSSYQSGDPTPALNFKLDDFELNPNPSSRRLEIDLGTSPSISSLPGHPFMRTIIDPFAYLAYRKQELRALVDTASTVIGICGQEGVGKTNLAREVSEEISPQFQHNFFMTNVSNKIQRQDSSLLLNFACESLKESSFHGSSDDAIKEIIGLQKVLLVADGVDNIKDLKSIIKDASRLGPGSRVIVITQDRSLLTQCGVKHFYEVECPNYEEALAFFSEFAFKQRSPLPGFEDLSFRAVQVSNRLPLALKMLGSFLCNKEKDKWVSTLRRVEASHNNYAAEVCRYIGVDDYAPRRPMEVDKHIGVDEAKRFPFYRFALK